jgi:hypothetical protein
MPVKRFDRSTADAIVKEVIDAAQGVARRYGINISRGNGTFSDNNFSFKINCDVIKITDDGKEVVETKERTDFKRSCWKYRLTPDHLDKTFHFQGQTFTITGLKPRSRKYPICVTRSDGERRKISARVVQIALGV